MIISRTILIATLLLATTVMAKPDRGGQTQIPSTEHDFYHPGSQPDPVGYDYIVVSRFNCINCHNFEDDQNPTPEDVAKMDAELSKNDKVHEFHSYPGCGHGFHCNARSSYRPESARDAWAKTMAWFDQHLKG